MISHTFHTNTAATIRYSTSSGSNGLTLYHRIEEDSTTTIVRTITTTVDWPISQKSSTSSLEGAPSTNENSSEPIPTHEPTSIVPSSSLPTSTGGVSITSVSYSYTTRSTTRASSSYTSSVNPTARAPSLFASSTPSSPASSTLTTSLGSSVTSSTAVPSFPVSSTLSKPPINTSVITKDFSNPPSTPSFLTTNTASPLPKISESSSPIANTWTDTTPTSAEPSRTPPATLPASSKGVLMSIPPPTSSSSSISTSSHHHSPATGIIIGAVIGGVILVAALSFILLRCRRKHGSMAATSHNRHRSVGFGTNILTFPNIPGLGNTSEGNYTILPDPPMSSHVPPSPLPQIQHAPSPLTPEVVPASREHQSLNAGVISGAGRKRASERTHRSYDTRSLDNTEESCETLPAYFSELGFHI